MPIDEPSRAFLPAAAGAATMPDQSQPDRSKGDDLGSLRDELIPADPKAKQMPRPEVEGGNGEKRDTAGSHGEMAPEAAKGLDEEREE